MIVLTILENINFPKKKNPIFQRYRKNFQILKLNYMEFSLPNNSFLAKQIIFLN